MGDLGAFIAKNFTILKGVLAYSYEKSKA